MLVGGWIWLFCRDLTKAPFGQKANKLNAWKSYLSLLIISSIFLKLQFEAPRKEVDQSLLSFLLFSPLPLILSDFQLF